MENTQNRTKRKRKLIPQNINKSRLKKEIVIISIIIIACLAPWVCSLPLPAPSDPYADYKHLYHIVEHYDYSKGPDENLENRIYRSIDSNSSATQFYFNLKAKLEYYSRLGDYGAIEDDFKDAYNFAPSDEEIEYLDNLKSKISP